MEELKILNEKELTDKQKLYFTPSKAAKYKEYIIQKVKIGLGASAIYKDLLKDYPQEKDVSFDSVRRLASRIKKKTKTTYKPEGKSEQVRIIAREMIASGIRPNCTEIINALNKKGIKIYYSHVLSVLKNMGLKGEIKEIRIKDTVAKIAEEVSTIKYSLEELFLAKEYLEKFEDSNIAIDAINNDFTTEELSLAKDFVSIFDDPNRAISLINSRLTTEKVDLAKKFSEKFSSKEQAVGAIKSYSKHIRR